MSHFVPLNFTYWYRTKPVTVPYQAYVPHLLANWFPKLDVDTFDAVSEAERKLGELRRTVDRTPGLAWILNETEGIASSQIEGLDTTLRSVVLLKSLRGRRSPGTDQTDRLVSSNTNANIAAMSLGSERDRDIHVEDVERLHKGLFAGTLESSEAGRCRMEPVWIGKNDQSPEGATYVPPPYEMVRPLMNDLANYISLPLQGSAVAKAAVVHTQFEVIHPFFDGNGRIGRALIHTVLNRDMPFYAVTPLSSAIDVRRKDYYSSFAAYHDYTGESLAAERSERIKSAVEFIADTVSVACEYATEAATELNEWHARIEAASVRSGSAASDILTLMQTMPAVTQRHLSETLDRPFRSVGRGLRQLVDKGLLSETYDVESGTRVFEAKSMLEVVDNRASRLRLCWDRLAGKPSLEHARPTDGSDVVLPQVAIDYTTRATRCGRVGVRSGRPCVRRKGHPGAHQY